MKKNKQVKINESTLMKVIAECTRKALNEANSYGWVVEDEEAEMAYDFFVEEMGGNEEADRAIVKTMGNHALADILAYLFRMYNLKGWEEYRDSH